MENLNINISGKVRTETLNEREYLVAPLSLIIPGVLNGSRGPLLYPLEEIQKTYLAWNSIPIVNNHPFDESGKPVSARSPHVLANYFLGYVFNARVNDGLFAEGWFDVLACNAVDPRIISLVSRGESIELSTGLFTTNEYVNDGDDNIFVNSNGTQERYIGIARSHVPDHLAILLDDVGACSRQKGCGVMVKNKGEEKTKNSVREIISNLIEGLMKEEKSIVDNEAGFSEIRSQIRKKINERFPGEFSNVFVEEVFSDHFIFGNEEDLFRLNYTEENGIVTIENSLPSKVIKKVEYPVTNKESEEMTISNEKQELVDNLINDCDCGWEEGDRETLNSFSEEKLQKFQSGKKNDKGGKGGKGGKGVTTNTEQSTEQGTEQTVVTNSQPKTEVKVQTKEESLQAMHPEVREAVENMMQETANKKQEFISKLTANISDEAKKERITVNLKEKTVPELQDMVEMLGPEAGKKSQQTNNVRPNARFMNANMGSESTTPQGEYLTQNNASDEEDIDVMVPTVLNYSEISKENAAANASKVS